MKTRPLPARLRVPTTWGFIDVTVRDGAVVGCRLPVLDREPAVALDLKGAPTCEGSGRDLAVLRQAARFVVAAVQGKRATCPPLRDEPAGDFIRRVRLALRAVKPGSICTYGELAAAAGNPRAARAAGSACAGNPLPLFIPCHRVVGAGGRLGGFTGGLAWKRCLLAREGAL